MKARLSPSGPFLTNTPGPGSSGRLLDLSVNAAAVDRGYADNSVVLRTGSMANGAGAFGGGGLGNKSILGVFGFSGLPLGTLASLAFTWESLLGPTGPNYNPPGGPTVSTPYMNLIVDFGGGDLRVLVAIADSLALAISAAIGTYSNPGGLNTLTYSWAATQDVLIVGSPPAPSPGGVPVNVSTGPGFLNNSYKFSALVAANPLAKLVDAYTGDAGLPVGAITPAVLLVSGDSGAVIKSGKKILSLAVNGSNVLA